MRNDDRQILALLRDADTKELGFNRLVARYKRPLYARTRSILGCHADADDALQNALIKVWNHIDGFREDSNLFTWLYRIATNEALMLVRKNKTRPTETDPDALSRASTTPDHDGPSGQAILDKLTEAVAGLPPKQRMIFEMRYFGEMPYREIASLTGTGEGALKAGYFHAVRKIEKFLSK